MIEIDETVLLTACAFSKINCSIKPNTKSDENGMVIQKLCSSTLSCFVTSCQVTSKFFSRKSTVVRPF